MSTQASHPTPEERRSADEVLRKAPFAFVAMVEGTNPYVVPMNFAYIPGRLFFHTGPGRKTAALAVNPRVCLAITADEAFDQGTGPCGDGYSFKAVLVEGWATLLTNPDEREKALRTIVTKYDPKATDLPFDDGVFAQTLVYAVVIESLSYRELRPRGPASTT